MKGTKSLFKNKVLLKKITNEALTEENVLRICSLQM